MLVMFYFIAAVIFMRLSAAWGSAGASGLISMVTDAKSATEQSEGAGKGTVKAGVYLAKKKMGIN
jgi:hypothetical protein